MNRLIGLVLACVSLQLFGGEGIEDAILKDWFGGYNARDWSAVKGLYRDDAVIHGKECDLVGGEAVVELARRWLEAMPDAQIIPLHTSHEDAGVIVVHWRAEGTLLGAIHDFPATGKRVAFHGLTCFRCLDGKIIEHWACVDYRSLSR